MKKNRFYITSVLALTTLLAVGAGCSSTTSTTTNTNTDTAATTNTETTDDSMAITADPGQSPFLEYPRVGTTAKVGEYVLAPSRAFIDEAFEEGTDSTTFVFYSSTMAEVGELESTLDQTFEEVTMPNSFIIPLPAGATASEGDVLLTWWQTGSGMQRAYVTDATNPSQPVVKYLDLSLTNPATTDDGTPIGQAEYTLKADSFTVLEGEFTPGSAVAVSNDAGSYTHYQVVNEAEGKLLVIGFAGKMAVVEKADAVALPVVPTVVVGDEVMAPRYGSMQEATVTRVDAEIGRVFVEFSNGATEEVGVPYGDVILATAL